MITLYPAVDIRAGRAVRLSQGRADEETVYDADPVAAARRWADAGAEWLHVVDLDAAFTGEPANRHLIAEIVEATGCRVQASGGVRTLEDVEAALGYGAERVVIGTMALEDPGFVRTVLDEVGPRVAVGLDARGRTLRARGWTEESGDLFEAVEVFADMGVPRLVYTDITRDGMLERPNLEMLAEAAEAAGVPVTASGGVASLDDLRGIDAALEEVDAAIVGRALYAGRIDIADALAVCRGEGPS